MTTLAELLEQDVAERVREVEPQPPTPRLPAPRADLRFFSSVLLEVDRSERQRKSWSAVSSVVLQCLILAILLIFPLMFTEALPKAQLLTLLVAPPPPPPPPPPAASAPAQIVRTVESDIMNGELRMPSKIPAKVQMIREDEAPPQLNTGGGVVGGVPGGIPGGQLGGVIGGIVNSTANLALVPKFVPAQPTRVRVSQGVVAGLCVHKVEPVYPFLAKQARVQGVVVLSAVISKEGVIENLQLESGHPLLVQAAINAVQQWRYRPFLLNGVPVEVETKVTVTFLLTGQS